MSLATSKPAAPPLSKKAVAALVLALLLPPVGLVVAGFALAELSRAGPGSLRGRGYALGAFAVGGAVLAIAALYAFAPGFVGLPCSSMQAEAKRNLKSAYVALKEHHAKHGTYGSLEETGFRPTGERPRYRYELVESDAERFVVRAIATSPDLEGDVWELTQDLQITHVSDGCR